MSSMTPPVTAEPVVRQPRWDPFDVLALSFVAGLSLARFFELLRGEPTEGDARQPTLTGLKRCSDITGLKPRDQYQDPGEGQDVPPGFETLESALATLGYDDPALVADQARSDAADGTREARERGIEAVPWLDARYPQLLACIYDPPLVLWVRGCTDDLSKTAVAIVGSRVASPYGEETSRRLASDLAVRGLVIVSGLALGIDGAAHRGALDAHGRTVAVLGCGVDVAYPPEHAALMDEVVASGAVISELYPGSRPTRYNFPRRNRIISGLSIGVVVVEARQRSGALITADCALAQGRDVMAVPGSVLRERHRGSHTLLKAGAALVETADDVLDVVTHAMPAETRRATAQLPARPVGLLPADPILGLMERGEAYDVDALSSMSGADVARLLPRLLELELQGRLRRLPGGRFVRSDGTC